MGLTWNWRERRPRNLLTTKGLSVDYPLSRSSICEKRPARWDGLVRNCDALWAAIMTLFVVPVERSFRLVFRQLRESARELRKLLRPQAPLCVQQCFAGR